MSGQILVTGTGYGSLSCNVVGKCREHGEEICHDGVRHTGRGYGDT